MTDCRSKCPDMFRLWTQVPDDSRKIPETRLPRRFSRDSHAVGCIGMVTTCCTRPATSRTVECSGTMRRHWSRALQAPGTG